MTQVNPTSNVAPGPTTQAENEKGILDKDGFLKLFVAQLTHQDPMSPMDSNQSMQQMASFSMVEQITNMASTTSKLAATMGTSSAIGLIGRTVTYVSADDQLTTGTVERVATSVDGTTSITVDGVPGIDPKTITEVA